MAALFRRSLGIVTAIVSFGLASPAAAANSFHVALIGDSLASGAGDEAGKGIAGRLEPELRRRGVESVAATNFGVTGATTRDLESALGRAPIRAAIRRADAVVVSIGANDLRGLLLGEEPVRSPLLIAGEVLQRLGAIVATVRELNPKARILVLGAYVPVAHERAGAALEPLVAIWDAMLIGQFADDPLVSVVRMSDIVDGPERLSRLDSFHPGGEAYQETAERIADLLTTNVER